MSINIAKTKGVFDVIADFVSAPRNFITGVTHGASPALPFLVVTQGSLAIATGSYTAGTSFLQTCKAIKEGDSFGAIQNGFGTLAGLAQTSLGCAALSCGSATLSGNAAMAASAGNAILPSLMGTYSLFLVRSLVAFTEVDECERSLSLDDEKLFGFLKTNSYAKRVLQGGSESNMTEVRQKIRRQCCEDKVTHIAVMAICFLGIFATYSSLALQDICPEFASIPYVIGAVLWVFIDCAPLHNRLRNFAADKILGPES